MSETIRIDHWSIYEDRGRWCVQSSDNNEGLGDLADFLTKEQAVDWVTNLSNADENAAEVARLTAIIDETRVLAQSEIDEPWDEHTDDLARRFLAILNRAKEQA
jgi:hypothetical protein